MIFSEARFGRRRDSIDSCRGQIGNASIELGYGAGRLVPPKKAI